MTHVLHRSLCKKYPIASGGENCVLIDKEGRRYIDGSSGASVSCLGHQHPDVLAAMRRQLDTLAYAHSSFFSSDAAEELADDLIEHAPSGFMLVQFVSSGSEAVEAALKIARQFHVENGDLKRRIFVARRQSYHGSTLGALAVTGRASARSIFDPLLMQVARVAPCFEYRERGVHEDSEAYGTRLAKELEAEFLRLGPELIAGFIAETVVGATLGAVPSVPGYFSQIRDVCDRYGVLLILDEVMCGMGRTGTMYACEQENVIPDLITLAKGLGGGYAPIGALLVSNTISSRIREGSGAFQHTQTYTGHSLACAAALAVQKVIRRDRLLENVRRQGERLRARLRERLADDPFVGDIRGRGLLCGVEFVIDRVDKRPFPVARKLHLQVHQQAMSRGLLVHPMGGTLDGVRGDHILIAPPFVLSDDIVDSIVERLGDAIDAATATDDVLQETA
jgi:adenosylmethionine-8-amino-7-oxononanoate aminotransferase